MCSRIFLPRVSYDLSYTKTKILSAWVHPPDTPPHLFWRCEVCFVYKFSICRISPILLLFEARYKRFAKHNAKTGVGARKSRHKGVTSQKLEYEQFQKIFWGNTKNASPATRAGLAQTFVIFWNTKKALTSTR